MNQASYSISPDQRAPADDSVWFISMEGKPGSLGNYYLVWTSRCGTKENVGYAIVFHTPVHCVPHDEEIIDKADGDARTCMEWIQDCIQASENNTKDALNRVPPLEFTFATTEAPYRAASFQFDTRVPPEEETMLAVTTSLQMLTSIWPEWMSPVDLDC